MKFLVALCCVLAVAAAKPGGLIAPLTYSNIAYSAPIHTPLAYTHAISPVVHTIAAPLIEKTQYHAQDTLGQASYGHSEPLQAHNAVQDASGNKVGSYSYVAPDGQVISTNYVADALGYRASSNALPVAPSAIAVSPAETPEVIAARAAHLHAHAVARSRSRRGIAYAPAALTYHAPLVSSYSYATPLVRTAVVNTPAHAVYHHVY